MIKLSVVVIGRNEGPLLTECLQSVRNAHFPKEELELIYVDSSSEDDSVQRANQFKAQVIHLQDPKPNAAKARNKGWQAAKGELILFLDGDTTLAPHFLSEAIPLFENPKVGIVFGKITEKHPEISIYNRVINVDWRHPLGEVDICGGNHLIRHDVLKHTNGFNGELPVGEESVLCLETRTSGYSIVSLNASMITHDLDMHSFKEYWMRCMRTGFAYASVFDLTKNYSRPLWKSRVRSNIIKTLLLFIGLAIAIYFLIAHNQPAPFLLTGALILFLIIKTILKSRYQGIDWKTSLYYGIHSQFQHIPMFFGQCQFWVSKIKSFC